MEEKLYIPETTYLKSIIRSIWQVYGHPGYDKEIIVPKGIAEMIFDLGESKHVQVRLNGREFPLAKCFMSSFNTLPIYLNLPQHQTFFGIQFHPVVIKHLFNVPAGEFTNDAIDMTLLDSCFGILWEQLAEHTSFKQRVDIIIKWVERKCIELTSKEYLLNAFLINPLLKTKNVPDLAEILCYSPRHLSRKIYDLTKMNTEEMLLFKKYLNALHLMHSSDDSLTEIGYKSGFADQSHFIKTFKSFTLDTPGNYRECMSHLAGHIYENVR